MTTAEPDWQPVLRGTSIHMRPLRADDFEALHQAASDPLIWAQHSVPDRHERDVFRRFFDGALACGGGLVAQDPATGRVIGSSRYYEWNPADRTVVIGYSFLERAQWGTGANREMKSLMIEHAFRWAEVVLFHVSPGNVRSQRALEKIGAQLLERTEVLVGDVMSPRHIYAIRRHG